MAKLWQEVLGLQQVGIDENFFELGGQSLMAVTLVTETGRVFGGRFSLASVISAPTIRQFAGVVLNRAEPASKAHSAPERDRVEQQVRHFIAESYLSGHANGLKNGDSFLKNRILDKMDFLQIAAFLQETYGISVKDEELICANMDSIDNVSGYVLTRLNGSARCEVDAHQCSSENIE